MLVLDLSRTPAETATYSDVDLVLHQGVGVNRITYKDGTDWDGPR